MKQEISDTTLQSNTQEKNSKLEVLNINHFHQKFLKEQQNENAISLKLFKKIVYEYLKIYFYELYFLRVTKYFFLGGKMKIVTYPTWVKKQRRGRSAEETLHRSERPLGLFWFLRPSRRMYFMVKLKKLTGSTNILPKIEQSFLQKFDKDLLPIFTNEQKKGRENKTLYRCIQH